MNTKRIHGHCANGTVSPEYCAWDAMKQRCHNPRNPAFKYYGARGIRVCKRWYKSFPAFIADIGLRPNSKLSLERKNNNGNYEPGNCKWATRSEQRRNMRQKGSCKHGHPLSGNNLHVLHRSRKSKFKERVCIECRRVRSQEYRRRHSARYRKMNKLRWRKRKMKMRIKNGQSNK